MMRFIEGLGGGTAEFAVALGLAVFFALFVGFVASRLIQPGRGGQFVQKFVLCVVALGSAGSLYFFSGPAMEMSERLPAVMAGKPGAQLTASGPEDPAAEARRRMVVAEMQASPAVDAFLRDADYASAEAALRLEITAALRTGDDTGRAWALVGLGQTKMARGDLEAAKSHFKLALSLFSEGDELPGSTRALTHLGMVSWARGETREAAGYFDRAMEIDASLDHQLGVREELKSLGMLNRND
jgi:tetratricopeptide (TPR) repeat protein